MIVLTYGFRLDSEHFNSYSLCQNISSFLLLSVSIISFCSTFEFTFRVVLIYTVLNCFIFILFYQLKVSRGLKSTVDY